MSEYEFTYDDGVEEELFQGFSEQENAEMMGGISLLSQGQSQTFNFYSIKGLQRHTNLKDSDISIVTADIDVDSSHNYPHSASPNLLSSNFGDYIIQEWPYYFTLESIATNVQTANPHFILCTKQKSSNSTTQKVCQFNGIIFVNKTAKDKLLKALAEKGKLYTGVSTDANNNKLTLAFFNNLITDFGENEKIYFYGRNNNYTSSGQYYGALLQILKATDGSYNFYNYAYSGYGSSPGTYVGYGEWKDDKYSINLTTMGGTTAANSQKKSLSPFAADEKIYILSISAIAQKATEETTWPDGSYVVGEINVNKNFFNSIPWKKDINKEQNITLNISNKTSVQDYQGKILKYPQPQITIDEKDFELFVEDKEKPTSTHKDVGNYSSNYVYELKSSSGIIPTEQVISYADFDITPTIDNPKNAIVNTETKYNYIINESDVETSSSSINDENILTVPVKLTIQKRGVQLTIDSSKCTADENDNSHSFAFSDIVTGNSENLPLAISFTSGGITYDSQITIKRDTTKQHEKSVSGQFIGSTSNTNYYVNSANATLTVKFANQSGAVVDPSKYVNVVKIDNNFNPVDVKQDEIIWNTISSKYNNYFKQIEEVLNQIVKALQNGFTEDSDDTNK